MEKEESKMRNMNVHICVPLPQSWTCLKCGEEINNVDSNRCPACGDSIAAQGANDEAWQEYAAKLPDVEDSWFGFEVNCSHGNCAGVEVENVEEFCKLVPEARPL